MTDEPTAGPDPGTEHVLFEQVAAETPAPAWSAVAPSRARSSDQHPFSWSRASFKRSRRHPFGGSGAIVRQHPGRPQDDHLRRGVGQLVDPVVPLFGRRPEDTLSAFLAPGPPGAGDTITTAEEHGCVTEMLEILLIEATFPDGRKLVTLRPDPCPEDAPEDRPIR
uniref:Urease subunit gamma n=1 Tax=Streptomyces sp. NBC_00008 TaxID=2903610 RepID=A0AAU2W2R3_9ACTN